MVGELDEAGQVMVRADRGEGPGHGEQHHLPSLEKIVRPDVLELAFADRDQLHVGDLLPDLDRHLWVSLSRLPPDAAGKQILTDPRWPRFRRRNDPDRTIRRRQSRRSD
jgi:hypothetical protein